MNGIPDYHNYIHQQKNKILNCQLAFILNSLSTILKKFNLTRFYLYTRKLNNNNNNNNNSLLLIVRKLHVNMIKCALQ